MLYGFRNSCATDAEHRQPVGAQEIDVATWQKRRDGGHRDLVPSVRTPAFERGCDRCLARVGQNSTSVAVRGTPTGAESGLPCRLRFAARPDLHPVVAFTRYEVTRSAMRRDDTPPTNRSRT